MAQSCDSLLEVLGNKMSAWSEILGIEGAVGGVKMGNTKMAEHNQIYRRGVSGYCEKQESLSFVFSRFWRVEKVNR